MCDDATYKRLVASVAGLDDLAPDVFRAHDWLRRRDAGAQVDDAVEVILVDG